MPYQKISGIGPSSRFYYVPTEYSDSSSGRNPPYFVGCSAAGCTTTSARGERDSLALRIGFSYCLKHLELSENEVRNRVNDSLCADLSMITVIFYSLQLSANGQVEQLSAFALTGENFSAVIKTNIRATRSPNLKVIPPKCFDVIAEDLTAAITRFLQWTRMVHSMRTRGNQETNNILLTAHGGAFGDHVYLIRAMLACGIEPPHFRLADSVALHNRFSKQECLERLAAKHICWLNYLPYSACSTARVLRAITIIQFPKTTEACYTFSASYTEFANRTGLSMYGIRELPFLSNFLENALN